MGGSLVHVAGAADPRPDPRVAVGAYPHAPPPERFLVGRLGVRQLRARNGGLGEDDRVRFRQNGDGVGIRVAARLGVPLRVGGVRNGVYDSEQCRFHDFAASRLLRTSRASADAQATRMQTVAHAALCRFALRVGVAMLAVLPVGPGSAPGTRVPGRRIEHAQKLALVAPPIRRGRVATPARVFGLFGGQPGSGCQPLMVQS